MSTPEEPDWVRQGTPRDVDAEWNDEQSEYGTTVSPVEWDDYSSEQSVPVERPRPVVQPPVDSQPEGSETAELPAEAAGTVADELGPDETVADEPVLAEDVTDDPVAADGVVDEDTETSDDAALFGAPLEDQPVLPEDVAEETTLPAPEPSTDIPAPVVDSQSEQESFEEESLDEPTADSYDEPLDDEPIGDEAFAEEATVAEDPTVAEPLTEPEPLTDPEQADTEPPADELDPDATRVVPAYVPEEDVADEPLADDGVAEQAADDTAEDTGDPEDDPDATRVVPVAVGAAGATAAAGASPLPDDLYRTGETAVIDDREALAARAREADEAEARERELQAQLDAERRARDERLGVVATSPENAVRDPATAYKVSTDRFLGSLGLFVLRLVTAAILGITGYQVLTNVDQTTEFLGQTMIPEPRMVTWIVGFTLGALALLLVIGLLQRVVGVVLLLLSIGSLVFIRWGSFSPFVEGREGFLGDKTLLLVAVAFVLIGLGGGLWGVDGAFRRARAAAKAERH